MTSPAREITTVICPPLQSSAAGDDGDTASDSLTPTYPSPEFPASTTGSFPMPHFVPLPCSCFEAEHRTARVRDNPLSVPDRRCDMCPPADDVLGYDAMQLSSSRGAVSSSYTDEWDRSFLPLSSQKAMSGSNESSCSTVHFEDPNYCSSPRRQLDLPTLTKVKNATIRFVVFSSISQSVPHLKA